VDEYRPLTSGQAFLFSAVMCRALQAAAEQAFAAAGVIVVDAIRPEERAMPPELQEAIRSATVAAC
jgi:hypothetical protein